MTLSELQSYIDIQALSSDNDKIDEDMTNNLFDISPEDLKNNITELVTTDQKEQLIQDLENNLESEWNKLSLFLFPIGKRHILLLYYVYFFRFKLN